MTLLLGLTKKIFFKVFLSSCVLKRGSEKGIKGWNQQANVTVHSHSFSNSSFVPHLLQDFKPLRDQEGRRYVDQSGQNYGFWIKGAAKDDEGVYTCVCTWMYNKQMRRSSASRRLELLGKKHSLVRWTPAPDRTEWVNDLLGAILWKLNLSKSRNLIVQTNMH